MASLLAGVGQLSQLAKPWLGCDVQEGGEGGSGAVTAARSQQHSGDHWSILNVAAPLRSLVVRLLRSHRLSGTSFLDALLLLQLRRA